MNFLQTIKFKLTFIMILLLVIPLVIVGTMYYQKTQVLEGAVIQKNDLENMSKKFNNIFQEYEQLIKDFSEQPELQYHTYDFSTQSESSVNNMPEVNDLKKINFYEGFFSDYEKLHDFLLNTYLATEMGELYLSNIPPIEVDFTTFDPRQRDWYMQAVQANGEVIWTTPYLDSSTGKSTITLAGAVKDKTGTIIGVIGFDFDMNNLAILLRTDMFISTLIVAAISVLIGIILVSLFVRSFNNALTSLQNEMARVAQGDLSIETLHTKRKDELGIVTTNFNQMVLSLKMLVGKVIDTSQQIASSAEQLSENAYETSKASEQIAGSIQEVSSGAEKQTEKVLISSTYVGQISEDIDDINFKAENMARSSDDTLEQSRLGSIAIHNAMTQMSIITENAEDTANVISLLNQKSNEIEEIITLINHIAEQTGLLALNAAIEAARAGEHGKGFAVVAGEVKKLAEQSSKSTQQINTIINEIQTRTLQAVDSMKNGEIAVKKGTHLVGEAGNSFIDIHKAVEDVSIGMNGVSESLRNINQHTISLVDSIHEVDVITSHTSAHSQEVAAAAEQQTASMEEVSAATKMLADMSEELQEVARKFKI